MEIQSLEGAAEPQIWLQSKVCVKRTSFCLYPLSKCVCSIDPVGWMVYLELWLMEKNSSASTVPFGAFDCFKKCQGCHLVLFFNYWWKREAHQGFKECLPAKGLVHRLLVQVQTSLRATRMGLSAWLTWSVSGGETALPFKFSKQLAWKRLTLENVCGLAS